MNELAPILGQIPLFASLSPDALLTLASHMRRRRAPAGTALVYRGDPSGALYLILSGRVKVHTATINGDEVILDVLSAGNCFGEMSLLDGQPRSADVSTLEPTELALLDGSDLRRTIEAQPAVAWALLSVLSRRLREQNAQIEMLMTRDVAGRVAGLLLRLADTQGTPLGDRGRIRIDVCLTQSDIAAFVGATRERVSRALSAFRTQGAISWEKETGHWIICSRPALVKRAEM